MPIRAAGDNCKFHRAHPAALPEGIRFLEPSVSIDGLQNESVVGRGKHRMGRAARIHHVCACVDVHAVEDQLRAQGARQEPRQRRLAHQLAADAHVIAVMGLLGDERDAALAKNGNEGGSDAVDVNVGVEVDIAGGLGNDEPHHQSWAVMWFRVSKIKNPSSEEFRKKTAEYFKKLLPLFESYPKSEKFVDIKKYIMKRKKEEIEKIINGKNPEIEKRYERYIDYG